MAKCAREKEETKTISSNKIDAKVQKLISFACKFSKDTKHQRAVFVRVVAITRMRNSMARTHTHPFAHFGKFFAREKILYWFGKSVGQAIPACACRNTYFLLLVFALLLLYVAPHRTNIYNINE